MIFCTDVVYMICSFEALLVSSKDTRVIVRVDFRNMQSMTEYVLCFFQYNVRTTVISLDFTIRLIDTPTNLGGVRIA